MELLLYLGDGFPGVFELFSTLALLSLYEIALKSLHRGFVFVLRLLGHGEIEEHKRLGGDLI